MGRGRVIYIFFQIPESRVQGPGSRVQGPVKLLGNDLKMQARLIEQLRFTDLFAQYFD